LLGNVRRLAKALTSAAEACHGDPPLKAFLFSFYLETRDRLTACYNEAA